LEETRNPVQTFSDRVQNAEKMKFIQKVVDYWVKLRTIATRAATRLLKKK